MTRKVKGSRIEKSESDKKSDLKPKVSPRWSGSKARGEMTRCVV